MCDQQATEVPFDTCNMSPSMLRGGVSSEKIGVRSAIVGCLVCCEATYYMHILNKYLLLLFFYSLCVHVPGVIYLVKWV